MRTGTVLSFLLSSRKLIPALSASVVLFAGCTKAPPVVKIGVASPLTGDQAKIGQDLLNGVKLAVKEANDSGGVLGRKIVVYALDDQHNATQAVSAAHRFVSDPEVLAVIGHLNSACTLPASDVYASGGMVMITPTSTNMSITRRGLENVFRICAHDGTQGSAAASFAVNRLQKRRIYVLDDKSTYGQGVSDEFVKAALKFGGVISGRDSINQGDKDFNALLTKISALRVQMVYFGGMYPEGSLIAKQARELGLKITLMGPDGLYDKTLIKLAGTEAAEGVFATMVGVDMGKMKLARDFIQRYEQEFGPIGPYSPYSYDAARIAIQAMARAGSPDRAKILSEVRKTRNFQGITGTTNFDKKGDTLNQAISVYSVQEGEWAYRGLASGKI